MKRRFQTLAAVIALAMASVVHAQAKTEAPAYGPYTGDTGYQEIQLSADSWYVAFHGNRNTNLAWAKTGWAARAAQLCGAQRMAHYVELRYPFEPLTAEDQKSANADDAFSESQLRRASHYVYIPIYTPSGSAVTPRVSTPSKLAAVRCVKDMALLMDQKRAVTVEASLNEAEQSGMRVR